MPDVGWRLAEEIAWARPERPGPEWWTLLDIAQDARDETRQSMCGQDYLMKRADCSSATLYRRLKALRDAGLLIVAEHSGPLKRAVYEIPLLWKTPEHLSSMLRGVRLSQELIGHLAATYGITSQSEHRQLSNGAVTPLTNAESPSRVSYGDPLPDPPSTSNGSVSHSNLEGTELSTGRPAGMSKLEKAAWQAAESRQRRAS